MAKSIKDIEKLIAEKNIMIKSLSHKDNSDREKIHKLKIELDSLLYSYYKSLKCRIMAL